MVKTTPPLNVFVPTLNDWCRKYLVAGPNPLTPFDTRQAEISARKQDAALFEQLLLFDSVSFKVFGENIPVIVLLKLLGTKVLEALIEQGAIRFVLWTPMVTYLKDDLPGINALQAGHHTSPAHIDPEESLEQGFRWLPADVPARVKKMLRRKVLPLYTVADTDLSARAVEFANGAFTSGRLSPLGLDPERKSLENLSHSDRMLLCKCATELLDYRFVLLNKLTASARFEYFSYFSDSIQRLKTAGQIASDFNELAQLEQFPDLQALYPTLRNGFAQLPKLRQRREARKFRSWFATATQGDGNISKEYLDSIANAVGMLDRPAGKFLKAVVMAGIGTGLGTAVDQPLLGLAAGGIIGAFAEHLSLDIVDEFLLDTLRKGWQPRVFFDELRNLEHPDLRAA